MNYIEVKTKYLIAKFRLMYMQPVYYISKGYTVPGNPDSRCTRYLVIQRPGIFGIAYGRPDLSVDTHNSTLEYFARYESAEAWVKEQKAKHWSLRRYA